MKLMDCTLRDGANVVGKGFSKELTVMMIEGLIKSGVTTIEMGNALGIGAYEGQNSVAPLTDNEYLDVAQPYLPRAEIGMFIGVRNAVPKYIDLAASRGLHFLRVGANAGDGDSAIEGIKYVKKKGLFCRYSLMKGYILSAKELAAEAAKLEAAGLDEITIMDSAGTMTPEQVGEYVSEMAGKIKIPVAFHGHNNLGLSAANAIAAERAGAGVLDCGLMGMARSAGNLATELALAIMNRRGVRTGADFYTLLHFIDEELAPAMARHNYHAAITPVDLVYGLAGCHSSFAKLFEDAAKRHGVDLYRLIMEVSAIDQKAPSAELIDKIACDIKGGN
ncbi:MAG: 4-hydroxy-2-oxovalerate aldolase [Spirochaetales bacterium]|jgi:4-hydroxy-2-oxovalerate aldolase|nr:4-hydroxy-2-oxovalerate aldolase [Spirochaetales bacterium]